MKAVKANRMLTIQEEKAEEYRKMGYDITDDNGRLISKSLSKEGRIESLEKELADTKKKLEDAEVKLKESDGKLEEAAKYAEAADKRIESLEKELADTKKKLDSAKTAKQEKKPTAEK